MIDASAAPRIKAWVSAMMLSPRETEKLVIYQVAEIPCQPVLESCGRQEGKMGARRAGMIGVPPHRGGIAYEVRERSNSDGHLAWVSRQAPRRWRPSTGPPRPVRDR
jgi:hypothetical protein